MTTALRASYVADGPARRRAILRYLLELDQWMEERPASVREVMAAVGLRSEDPTLHHLRTLQAEGLITMAPGLSRTIRLTPAGVLAAQGYRLLWRAEDL